MVYVAHTVRNEKNHFITIIIIINYYYHHYYYSNLLVLNMEYVKMLEVVADILMTAV